MADQMTDPTEAIRKALETIDESDWTLAQFATHIRALLDRLDRAERDAKRYRWLREQHEGQTDLENDADGFPMPLEPTALAFTVFRPDRGSLEPVGCIPGELDAAIDEQLRSVGGKEPK